MFSSSQKIRMVKIEEILPNPYQIRRNFEINSLLALADSIKEHGMLSPVILRTTQNGYEIICGQRRVRAAMIAGLSEVPSIIMNVKEYKCAELSMVENIHRKPLTYIEEGEGYFNLISYHRMRKEKLKQELSVDSLRINEKMRILRLDDDVRFKLEEKEIPHKIALELLKLHDKEKQLQIIDKIEVEELLYKEISAITQKEGRKKARCDAGKKSFDVSIVLNTVENTIDILKESLEDIKTSKTEDRDFVEYNIKIPKRAAL